MKKFLILLGVLVATASVANAQTLKVWTTWQDQTLDWLRSEAASFTSAFGVDIEIGPGGGVLLPLSVVTGLR